VYCTEQKKNFGEWTELVEKHFSFLATQIVPAHISNQQDEGMA